MEIDLKHVQDALKEMKNDSQNGIWKKFGKKSQIDDFCTIEQIENLIKFFDLPINLDMSLKEYKEIMM